MACVMYPEGQPTQVVESPYGGEVSSLTHNLVLLIATTVLVSEAGVEAE